MITTIFVAMAGAALAQSRPMSVVPPIRQNAAVMEPLNAWFAGIDANDADAIRHQLRIDGGGGATVAAVRPDGQRIVRHLSWNEYLANIKPSGHRYHEQFSATPMVRIDGDIAVVWGAFVLSIDGKAATCGVDHFDLVRQDGAWKVQNVTWSQRTEACSHKRS